MVTPQRRKVNNEIYETLGRTWWDENAGFEVTSLRYCMNPVRYAYFQRELCDLHPPSNRVLDIGCAGGFLSEEFSANGYEVSGIDPAANAIAAARAHAAETHRTIDYQVGRGESLPFPDNAFGIVACCDVLEHVDDPAQVLREVSRTLQPGGVFLYDTVNRTFRSWIALIKVWQDWNVGGFACPNAHVWQKFIKPEELSKMIHSAGLTPGHTMGITTIQSPPAMFRTLLKIRSGRLRGPAVAKDFALHTSNDLSVSYIGWAVKPD